MKKLLLAALVATSLTAHADFFDGNELHKILNDKELQGIGAGYIAGVADTMGGISICPPTYVTVAQMRDIIKQWLELNPPLRHNSADEIVNAVLSQIFPCKKTEKKPMVSV